MPLFPLTYLPSCGVVNRMSEYESVCFDIHEYYVKQTLRNRCYILSPNGPLALIIPVMHQDLYRTCMKDVKIANNTPWQRQHWRSLVNAYNRSPFFEYYRDDLEPLYSKRWEYLVDFSSALLNLIIELAGLKMKLNFTGKYFEKYHPDYRNMTNDNDPGSIPYVQVFTYKFGFSPGLSFADLLFNCGADGTAYLLNNRRNR